MPSSITLTVSHLPSSTSFFLSALQPLEYTYRGRTGQTIGFGSAIDKTAPADFWITQELPGIPAGAAHVAFPAPSRVAVQDFFFAALRAGGKMHGEPCVRAVSGYYSAAVIDFDGNSIEAVHRPNFSDDKENDAKTVVSCGSSVRRPSSVVRSTVSRTQSSRTVAPGPPPPQAESRDVVDSLLAEARNAADVARNLAGQVREHNASARQNNRGDSSGAVVGTLLGVAAGAALHFVFSNNSQSRPSGAGRSMTEPPRSEYSRYVSSRQSCLTDAPPSSYHPRMITMHDKENGTDYASTVRPRQSSSTADRSTASRRSSLLKIEAAPPTSYKCPTALTTTSSHRDGRSSRSRSSSSSRRGSFSSHSNSDRTIVRVTETVTSTARHPLPESVASKATSKRSSRATSPARYPLPASTISQASSARTAIRDLQPADYPLPPSRASTWAGSTTSKRESKSGRSHASTDSKSVISKSKDLRRLDLPKGELTPDDSVSQISVGRSERSRRSQR